ncbi:MAG TPA: hypothetical protein VF458_10215 [Ktedonobacteraceae bacterium]
MEQELHLPDFTVPDFAQPPLERVDLAQPGFVVPDPAAHPWPSLPMPEDLDRPATGQPDPALPDLLEPDRPRLLDYPPENERVLAEPRYEPDVAMQQRPGEPDPAALDLALGSPDEESLPRGLAYPQLYTNDDEMTRRKRRFAMRELGMEREARDRHDD